MDAARDGGQVTDLPELAHGPEVLPEGECPWQRYERAEHGSWAYRTNGAIVVRDLAVAKVILSDRRFEQGIRVMMERTPGLDERFVARRKQSLLLRDGPDHLRMRRIALKSAFTPRAADRHRPTMREIMEELADRVPDDGVCDAVAAVTHEYPTRVISHVLGTPVDDVGFFSALVETILNAQSGAPDALDDALTAHEQLDSYMLELIDQKRSHPGEDLLTDLVHAESEEGSLSGQEVLNTAVSVIMAGTDTTRNQLALGLHLFADHPAEWSKLSDDTQLTAAVDEMIRFAPIGHMLLRVPTSDVTVNDVHLAEGAMVVLDVGAANRDPAVVDDPHAFSVDRSGPPNHLGFGHGHKYCLGASLAKAELVEALRVLRARFELIEPAGPAVWRHVGFVQGPIELPLRLSPTSG